MSASTTINGKIQKVQVLQNSPSVNIRAYYTLMKAEHGMLPESNLSDLYTSNFSSSPGTSDQPNPATWRRQRLLRVVLLRAMPQALALLPILV